MYQVIVNPSARSGRGKRNWDKIKHVLDDHEVDYAVHFTQKKGDAGYRVKGLYKQYQEDNELLELLVLGGDGTLNEVINGLPSFENVTISCLPVGSSNDLARALGISFDPEEAVIHLLKKPTTLYMDVGTLHCENTLVREGNMTIKDRHFFVSCGIGYDASICHEANESHIKPILNRLNMGKMSYLFICLKQLISMKSVTAELMLDDDDNNIISFDKLVFLAGMNNKYEGGGFQFAPEASNHDGVLDLCAVSDMRKPKLLSLLPKALKGELFGNEGVAAYRAYKYTMRTSEPIWVHTDGEVDTKADFIEVTCQKEAVRLVY